MESPRINETAAIRRRNCSRVLRHLRGGADFNCRELSVRTELSIPTVSTIVTSLASQELLEPVRRTGATTGRPGNTFRIAGGKSQVMSVVVGTGTCSFVLISPDGRVADETLQVFDTPDRSDRLIDKVIKGVEAFRQERKLNLLGIGVAVPGFLSANHESVDVSANLPFLNGQALRQPIAQATGLPIVLLPSMEAHHLAESAFGPARLLEDFVVINFAGGIGVSVCMNGEFLRGRLGTGIELGHIPMISAGEPCGCGNRGCLEQYGSDETILRASRTMFGRSESIQSIVKRCRQGDTRLTAALHDATDSLAVAVATAINLFSPRKVLLYGHFLFACDSLFDRLRAEIDRRVLRSRIVDCEILPPQADAHRAQQLGASVAVVNELANSAASGKT